MKNIRKHYEDFWAQRNEKFENYPRNQALKKLFKDKEKILDVGCGDGAVGEFLLKRFSCEVYGIDISKEAVEKAKKRNVKAIVARSEDRFPFEKESFDAVFWGDNIEHLFDPLFTAREIKRVLKKNGRLILSCPNMGYWRYRFYYLMNGSLPDTEWTGHNPWNWSHIRFFNLDLLKQFIKVAGFREITKVLGISERRLDKLLLPLSDSVFGMIFILEVK